MSEAPPVLSLVDSFDDYPVSSEFSYADHLDPKVLYETKRLLNQIALNAGLKDYKIIADYQHITAFFKSDIDRDAFQQTFGKEVSEQSAVYLFFGGSDEQKRTLHDYPGHSPDTYS